MPTIKAYQKDNLAQVTHGAKVHGVIYIAPIGYDYL